MKNIQHIFFDLDDTLWDTKQNSKRIIEKLYKQHQLQEKLNASLDEFLNVYYSINKNLWQLYSENKITKKQLRETRFKNSFHHFNYFNEKEPIEISNSFIAKTPYETNLINGTIEILSYLSQKYNLHIITNGFKEVQHIKLKQSKLSDFFNHVIISEEFGYNKPDKKIFEIAEQKTGASKSNSIMIGDNPDTDILGANNAGWKSVYFNAENFKNPMATFNINTLIDIKSFL
ncbi:MAG: YjjG family noncanonical pyrimidine nucleotidase [Bacteroidetes bacterium]|nr:YjjG family noncanonical pyrimidine nucleotidase [Bacteroidota bacterium]